MTAIYKSEIPWPWRCYWSNVWLSAPSQPGHFTTLNGWQRQYFAMNILLKRQCEEFQSNTCLDWGRQLHLCLAWTLRWVSTSQPTPQARPLHQLAVGGAKLAWAWGWQAQNYGFTPEFSFWSAWNTRKANVHVTVVVSMCLLHLSLKCFYCSLLSTNTFPYMLFLMSLRKMFSLLPCVPYYQVYMVQVKWVRLFQWYGASCR